MRFCHTYRFRFEWRLDLLVLQLLPVDAGEEGVADHRALPALRAHAAQPVGRRLGQQLRKTTARYQTFIKDSELMMPTIHCDSATDVHLMDELTSHQPFMMTGCFMSIM